MLINLATNYSLLIGRIVRLFPATDLCNDAKSSFNHKAYKNKENVILIN